MTDDGTYQLRRGGGRKALVITTLFTTGAAAALGFGSYRLYTELELSLIHI